jgi:hypothetical protein
VPRPIALARQRAQEAVRHAPASPPVVVTEAPPPKPNDAQPQCKGGEDLTATAPLMGEGGTAGRGDSGGERAPPPTQLKALCVASPCTGSTRVEGGANGGTAVTRHSGLVPQGVSNLGEALAAISSLASFPPMPGAPAYKPWEACLQELSEYVQCCPIAGQHGSSPLVRELGLWSSSAVELLVPWGVRLRRG